MQISRKGLLRRFIAATCLLPIFSLTSLESTVCSWDYLIWMPHSEQADPLYRFVRNGKAGYIDRSGAEGTFAYIDVTGKKVFSYTNER